MSSSGLVGLVLIGGYSRRFGADKCHAKLFDDDSLTILERTLLKMKDLTDTCYIGCRREQSFSRDSCIASSSDSNSSNSRSNSMGSTNCIYDTVENIGPIASIHAALCKLNSPVLALSCDLPFLSFHLLQKLVHSHKQAKEEQCLTVFKEAGTGRLHTLSAIYKVGALAFLEKAMRQSSYRLQEAIPKENRQEILLTEEENKLFFNMNSQKDADLARAMARQNPHLLLS